MQASKPLPTPANDNMPGLYAQLEALAKPDSIEERDAEDMATTIDDDVADEAAFGGPTYQPREKE